jgi:CRP-like cAMP-binding protein
MESTMRPKPELSSGAVAQTAAKKSVSSYNVVSLVRKTGPGWRVEKCVTGRTIFLQGDPADSIFYILTGKVKLAVTNETGKEAIVAVLARDEFLGEECLDGTRIWTATATALADCEVLRFEKPAFRKLIQQEPGFSEMFITHVVERTVRVQADLVDQLFNSSEKRLARTLLLLANFGQEGAPQPLIARISQATLAEMVGTTRSRISFFMNKFRRLGFIDYDHSGEIAIHKSLLNLVLHERPQIEPQELRAPK